MLNNKQELIDMFSLAMTLGTIQLTKPPVADQDNVEQWKKYINTAQNYAVDGKINLSLAYLELAKLIEGRYRLTDTPDGIAVKIIDALKKDFGVKQNGTSN